MVFFFLVIPRPPRSTRTDTLFPYTSLFRSLAVEGYGHLVYDLARDDLALRILALARFHRVRHQGLDLDDFALLGVLGNADLRLDVSHGSVPFPNACVAEAGVSRRSRRW